MQRATEHQSIEYIFPIVRCAWSHYQIGKQGILLGGRAVHHTVPYDVCPTKTLQIPIPVVFKSKLHSAFLYDIIQSYTRKRLYTGAFAHLVDVTHRCWLLP